MFCYINKFILAEERSAKDFCRIFPTENIVNENHMINILFPLDPHQSGHIQSRKDNNLKFVIWIQQTFISEVCSSHLSAHVHRVDNLHKQ